MKIGYIGLGNLGGHLAASLIRAGFDVVVYDRDPDLAARHRDMGAEVADSPADLAARVALDRPGAGTRPFSTGSGSHANSSDPGSGDS